MKKQLLAMLLIAGLVFVVGCAPQKQLPAQDIQPTGPTAPAEDIDISGIDTLDEDLDMSDLDTLDKDLDFQI